MGIVWPLIIGTLTTTFCNVSLSFTKIVCRRNNATNASFMRNDVRADDGEVRGEGAEKFRAMNGYSVPIIKDPRMIYVLNSLKCDERIIIARATGERETTPHDVHYIGITQTYPVLPSDRGLGLTICASDDHTCCIIPNDPCSNEHCTRSSPMSIGHAMHTPRRALPSGSLHPICHRGMRDQMVSGSTVSRLFANTITNACGEKRANTSITSDGRLIDGVRGNIPTDAISDAIQASHAPGSAYDGIIHNSITLCGIVNNNATTIDTEDPMFANSNTPNGALGIEATREHMSTKRRDIARIGRAALKLAAGAEYGNEFPGNEYPSGLSPQSSSTRGCTPIWIPKSVSHGENDRAGKGGCLRSLRSSGIRTTYGSRPPTEVLLQSDRL